MAHGELVGVLGEETVSDICDDVLSTARALKRSTAREERHRPAGTVRGAGVAGRKGLSAGFGVEADVVDSSVDELAVLVRHTVRGSAEDRHEEALPTRNGCAGGSIRHASILAYEKPEVGAWSDAR